MRDGDREQRDEFFLRVIGQHAAHQFVGDFGQDRGCGDRRIERDGARHGSHVREADAHRHRSSRPRAGAQAGGDAVGEMQQRRADHARVGRPLAERGLRAGGTGAAVRPDRPRIPIPCQRRQLVFRRHAEQLLERPAGQVRQLPDGVDIDAVQPRARDGTDAPHQFDRQVVKEIELAPGIDHHEAVGLCDLRGDLGEMLCAGDADRDRKAKLGAHACADRACDLGRRAKQMRASGDVGKGLVDRDALDQRREIAEHGDRGIAQPLVLPEMAVDKDQLRTEFACPPSRHAAAHAERPGLVGGGEHDAAADRDRLAAQRRVEQLLDRCIKGVEIRVENGGRRDHPRSPRRWRAPGN